MEEQTIKEFKHFIKQGIIIVIGLFIITGSFLLYVGFMMNESKKKLHNRIRDNINLSKPYNDVIGIESDFISGAEYMYFVSILVTTDEYPGSPQWIYDFRYDDSTDTLYYDGNIKGISIIN